MLERGKNERGVIEMVDTESLVPAEHLFRQVDAAVDRSGSAVQTGAAPTPGRERIAAGDAPQRTDGCSVPMVPAIHAE